MHVLVALSGLPVQGNGQFPVALDLDQKVQRFQGVASDVVCEAQVTVDDGRKNAGNVGWIAAEDSDKVIDIPGQVEETGRWVGQQAPSSVVHESISEID